MKKYLAGISLLLLLNQCARTTQPNGGPKDIAPPELLKSIPINGQKNFKGKNIELEFDEYLKLKDPKEEILITPTAGPETKFIIKKNKLTIIPQYNWQDSTTYSIAFREGIQDLNEGNAADNLHLAFSTGNIIDSLQIFGSIDEAFIDKIPEKITIAAFQLDTFDIFRHKPTYFTKANKKGKFSIQNMKPGQYYLYAFEDKNKNFKVDSKSEKYGFNVTPVILPTNTDSVKISIFHCDSRNAKVTSVRNAKSVSTIRFNKLVSTANISANRPLLYSFGDNTGEIVIQKDFDITDSLLVKVHTLDSIQNTLDTAVYIKSSDSKVVDEKLKMADWKLDFDPETNQLKAETSSNKIIKAVNFDSIYIQIDTITIQQISAADYTFDTLRKKLLITKQLNVNKDETKRPNPVFIFGKGAFVSINNDSTKAQQKDIKIPKSTEVGFFTVEIKTEKPHFTISLLTTNNARVQSFSDQKKFTFKNIPSGEYKLLIHIDDNNDHVWNPGNFLKYVQPEKVFFYKFLGKKYTEPIRANWEVGPFLITF